MPKIKYLTQLGRWLLLGLIPFISGYSRFKQALYGCAMNLELGRADLTKKQVTLPEGKIIYFEGPKEKGQSSILLIHGFSANKENWIRFAGNFSKKYHVIAIDLPGHGDSFKNMNLKYDIDDQVKFVRQFSEQTGLKQFHIVGNSMGGAISALYTATYPRQVLTVTLIDPGGIYDIESDLQKALNSGKNPLVVRKLGDMKKLISFALVKKPFIPWPVAGVMEQNSIANAKINDKIFSDISGPHHYDFKHSLTEIKAPALLLWGKQDRAIDVKNADIFAQLIPNSKKVIFNGVGHAPMIEIPKKSAEVFINFIKQH